MERILTLIKGNIIPILFIIIVVLGILLYQMNGQLDRYEQDKRELVYEWVWQDLMAAQTIDYNLGVALEETNDEEFQRTIAEAQDYAFLINREPLFKTDFGNRIHGTGYSAFWIQSHRYLSYLQREKLPLADIQIENLKLIRKHTEVIMANLKKLQDFIGGKSYNELENNKEAFQIMDKLIKEIETLPNIGRDDPDYTNQRKTSNNDNFDIFKNENSYEKNELNNKVNNFMKAALSSKLMFTMTGGGSSPLINETMGFSNDRYTVEISKKGGHIITIFKTDKPNVGAHLITESEAEQLANQLIKNWEDHSLKLFTKEKSGHLMFFNYYPVKNDIPLLNRKVEVIINLETGFLGRFNTLQYFSYYGNIPNFEPKISKEEATSKLTKNVEVNGDIKLQVIDGNKSVDVLVYAIPIKGIDRVDLIYINARTGEKEGVHYLN